jgi:hypothetical protein
MLSSNLSTHPPYFYPTYTNALLLANFVGCVVGFLNVYKIRLIASSLPPRYPLTGCATKGHAIFE